MAKKTPGTSGESSLQVGLRAWLSIFLTGAPAPRMSKAPAPCLLRFTRLARLGGAAARALRLVDGRRRRCRGPRRRLRLLRRRRRRRVARRLTTCRRHEVRRHSKRLVIGEISWLVTATAINEISPYAEAQTPPPARRVRRRRRQADRRRLHRQAGEARCWLPRSGPSVGGRAQPHPSSGAPVACQESASARQSDECDAVSCPESGTNGPAAITGDEGRPGRAARRRHHRRPLRRLRAARRADEALGRGIGPTPCKFAWSCVVPADVVNRYKICIIIPIRRWAALGSRFRARFASFCRPHG